MSTFFTNYHNLTDNGQAWSRGVEFLIQKKMAKDFYGLVSASLFRCRYQDYYGKWRDRIYDNRYIFNLIGGYKPNNKWEFSIRWNFAGGAPYTPFDQEKSRLADSAVIDATRVNAERYPDYHTLNIRFDRRFYFNQSTLVAYFSLWNAYNQKNIATYYWNKTDNKQDTIYQWSFLPIGGFEFEF
ncbi:hypothetical protein JW960_22230 [candidate division KSB1 bacterium]|nr:hypothetical protein [candidate division KSB1 bacterium]